MASVQTQLILSEGRRSKAKDPTTYDAARQLARSWQRVYDLTAEALADLRMLAEKALEQDPCNGEAARLFATAIWHQIYMGYIPWDSEAIKQVIAFAKRAVEYSPTNEHAYWSMAFGNILMMEHEQAIVAIHRSLQINPNFSLGFGTLGSILAWAGKSDKSISNNETALRINPRDPSLFFRHFGLALAHYLARRYAEGLSHASEVMQLRPEWWLGRLIFAACLAKNNKMAEANCTIAELKKGRPDIHDPGAACATIRQHLQIGNTLSKDSVWRVCRKCEGGSDIAGCPRLSWMLHVREPAGATSGFGRNFRSAGWPVSRSRTAFARYF